MITNSKSSFDEVCAALKFCCRGTPEFCIINQFHYSFSCIQLMLSIESKNVHFGDTGLFAKPVY